MDEEAVRYLAEHVAKVKLEAAEKEYALSQEVDFLRVQSKEQNDKILQLERVIRENSLQWKLRERDDWKNLVSAVQRDRERLDEENIDLRLKVTTLRRQLLSHGIEPEARGESRASSPRGETDGSSCPSPDSTSVCSSQPKNSQDEGSGKSSPRSSPSKTIPQSTELRLKEMESQLEDSSRREGRLRKNLRKCEEELHMWKVVKHADLIAQIDALQCKLNMELEQKWSRRRGHRPLQTSDENGGTGVISRLIEVIAPYPAGIELDETRLIDLAITSQNIGSDSDEKT